MRTSITIFIVPIIWIWGVLSYFRHVKKNNYTNIIKTKWNSLNLELDIKRNNYKIKKIKNIQESFNVYCDAYYNEPEQKLLKQKVKKTFNYNLNFLINSPLIILTDEDINNIIDTLPSGISIAQHARRVWLKMNLDQEELIQNGLELDELDLDEF